MLKLFKEVYVGREKSADETLRLGLLGLLGLLDLHETRTKLLRAPADHRTLCSNTSCRRRVAGVHESLLSISRHKKDGRAAGENLA